MSDVAKVVSIVLERGFGFVRSDSMKKDAFFHAKACLTPFEELQVNDLVSCDIQDAPDGSKLRATKVKRI